MNQSGVVSSKSGGLYTRLMSYFINLGKNVRILHLRIFSSEDLNFLGKKLRAREYENAIKEELRKKNIQPIRGSIGSEYFKNVKQIQGDLHLVYKKLTLVRILTPGPAGQQTALQSTTLNRLR